MFNAYQNTATADQAEALLAEARKLAEVSTGMRSSADACIETAESLRERGPGFVHEWALESLAYSVGIFHPSYIKAKAESRA